MQVTFRPPKSLKIAGALMILAGVAAVITGFLLDKDRTWSNILLNNIYFLTIAIGAMLFYSIQYVTRSSWSAMLQRIPLSLGAFIPVAFILMLLLIPGLHAIYEWSEPGVRETDKLIQHKSPFLNVPFFIIRMVIYFLIWGGLWIILRRFAFREDRFANSELYHKSNYYSKVFIFSVVLLFSLAGIDWLMTIDAHWYSTMYGFRTMITSIYYGSAAIVLVVLYLNKLGYLEELNIAHRHDLARYLFRFSIVWGYLWFMQFLITWYANIPELTVYYNPRLLGEWRGLFYADMILNFVLPFFILISNDFARKKMTLAISSVIILIGLYIMLFLAIMPGSYGTLKFGFIEIGMWLGYLGLFMVLSFETLAHSTVIPVNHPQLEESIHHHI